MKNLLFAMFFVAINLSAQIHLNENWVLFNNDNSALLSNSINELFEDNDNGYWISSVGDNNNGHLQYFKDGIWHKFDSTNSPLNASVLVTDITQTSDGKILFGTAANGIYIKEGENWDSLNTNNSQIPEDYIFKILVDMTDRYWIGIPNYGIAVYDNGNWIFFNDQNSFNGIGDLNFIELDSSSNIWVGTDYFGLHFYDGNSWIKTIGGQFSGKPIESVTALSIDSANRKWATINIQGGGSKIAASLTDTSFVYFDSTDWGSQFTLFSYDGAVIDQNNVKYFGTTNGLLVYDDVNWQLIDTTNSPAPGNWFMEGWSDSRNNKVYLISSFQQVQNYGLIFFNQDSVSVTSLENHSHTISEYQLEQNYPNPFNPTTTIKFALPQDGIVSLKIFDVLGKEVKTLVDEYRNKGSYEVSFDASDLASGVYLYQIKVNDFAATKKMLLLK